jgi:heterotetrameric sarcosine oxidase gamma subunit
MSIRKGSGYVPDAKLTDCTDQPLVLVRADPGGALAAALDVPNGRAARDGDGALVVRTAPDAWLLLAPAATATSVVRRIEALGEAEFASVFDVTHGHALVRLTGPAAASVLARVCAIDLADAATPDGTAFRSLVAGIAATVVRDDTGPGRWTGLPAASLASLDRSDALGSAGATPAGGRDADGERSYLVQCDRSYGRYLVDVLTDAASY